VHWFKELAPVVGQETEAGQPQMRYREERQVC
jgi:hypothetical protein